MYIQYSKIFIWQSEHSPRAPGAPESGGSPPGYTEQGPTAPIDGGGFHGGGNSLNLYFHDHPCTLWAF